MKTRRRNRQVKRLNESTLKRMVMEELAKLTGKLEDIETVKAEEVEASDYADTLEKDIDIYKAMQIEEAKLRQTRKALAKRAKTVSEAKHRAKKRLLRKLK